MASIKLHAGDWGEGNASFMFGSFALPTGIARFEGVKGSDLEVVEVASEETVKKFAGAFGWGLAGALALGPLGLLAGLLAGGNKKTVTFIAIFKDKRKI